MAQELPYRGKTGDEPFRGDDHDEEEEDVDESGYKTVKDAVLFAIEVSDSMLKRPPPSHDKKADLNSPLSAALKCAYHLMQQRIISNPKDLMGILLYGTEQTKYQEETENSRGGWSFPHCYLLVDLAVPEAEDVKLLKELVEEDSEDSKRMFESAKEPVSMHSVLFCANQIFQTNAPNFTSRRLFIVTDNDDPHATNKAFRSQAAVRAKDLYDLGVVIELFPISTPNHTFDTKLFYDDIVYRPSPTGPDAISYNPSAFTDTDNTQLRSGTSDGITLLQSLLSTISSRATPKRALFASVPLELAPDLRISVKGYLLFKHQKPARSCYVYLGADVPQIAKGVSETNSGAAAAKVEKADIRKAFTFGGEQIIFTPDEVSSLRDMGDPIIRIVAFKPLEKLPLWANVKSSTFLYPSEEDYVGSTRVYSALYQKLAKSKLMGLTWFIPRKNAVPCMAALVPTLSAVVGDPEGSSNVSGVSSTGVPQGLHLIPLPFADDLRQNPPTSHGTPLRAPDELVDAMRLIIQQLTLPKHTFDPSRYANPSLQWHYRILQALALDEDLPEKPEDKTIPKFRQIDKRVGQEADEWGRLLERAFKYHISNHPDAAHIGTKRPPVTKFGDDAAGSSKKVKAETQDDNALSEDRVRGLMEKNKLGSITVAQLKDFCTSKRLGTGGKKAELVERIEQYFEHK